MEPDVPVAVRGTLRRGIPKEFGRFVSASTFFMESPRTKEKELFHYLWFEGEGGLIHVVIVDEAGEWECKTVPRS